MVEMNGGKKLVQPGVAAGAVQPKLNVFASGGVRGRFDGASDVRGVNAPVDGGADGLAARPVQDVLTGASRVRGVGGTTDGVPVFRRDASKRDGGFFGWLGGLVKRRPGRRDGESDDEYDERMTRNRMRMAVMADALRHMGNIYNVSRGAAVQRFGSAASDIEQGLEKRRAQRAAADAAAREAAYNDALLRMKENAAASDLAYKDMSMEMKRNADARAEGNMRFSQGMKEKQYDRAAANDAFSHGLANARLEETKRHNGVAEGQGAARIALSAERNAISRISAENGGSGKGGGSMTNLATPSGHMNRKKDLSAIEKKQLKDYLYKNGYITKDASDKYDRADNEQERGAILNGWIGWAANANGTAGWKFRKHLKDHYGYAETQTVQQGGQKPNGGTAASKPAAKVAPKSAPVAKNAPAAKSVQTKNVQAKGGGQTKSAPKTNQNKTKQKKGGWASDFKL